MTTEEFKALLPMHVDKYKFRRIMKKFKCISKYFVITVLLLCTIFIGQSFSDEEIDTDNDSLPDSWEMEYFGNLDNDSNSDFDSDGIINIKEFKLGSNPIDSTEAVHIKSFEYDSSGRIKSMN